MRAPNWSGWRAALRIARRDALRHKGRSALVVAMIALPVLGVTAADVLARSAQLTPLEKLTRQIGAADAGLTDPGQPVRQTPDGTGWTYVDGSGAPGSGPQSVSEPTFLDEDDLLALLPAGSRLFTHQRTSATVCDSTGGVVRAEVDLFDNADPVAKGIYRRVSGTAPRSSNEIELTTPLAKDLGLGVGDRIQGVTPARSWTVVGVVEDPGDVRNKRIVAPPGAFPAPESGGFHDLGQMFIADTPGPVTWDQVLALNARGVVVKSRYVTQHRPPRADVPYYRYPIYSDGAVDPMLVATGVVVVGMALLEVVLLAGPAFAVGARRSRRYLALIAATGGERRQVRNVVLGGGVVLGATGGVIGVALGVALAIAARPTLRRLAGTDFGGLHLHPWEIAGVALVGLVTGVLAAALPARAASRQDVVAALAGRRGVTRTPKALTIIGVIVFVLGVGAAALGAITTAGANVILAGSIVAELGLVACTPALVGLVSRLSPRLPAAPRLALRDTARNRGRTAPAVAAIMAAVAGTVAVTVYAASQDARNRAAYEPALRQGQVVAAVGANPILGDPTEPDWEAVATALRRTLPARSVNLVRAPGGCADATDGCDEYDLAIPPQNRCPVRQQPPDPSVPYEQPPPLTPQQRKTVLSDWRCEGLRDGRADSVQITVGDASLLAAVAHVSEKEASAALGRTGVVVFDRRYLDGGKVTFTVSKRPAPQSKVTSADEAGSVTTVSRPATLVEADPVWDGAFITPQMVAELGWHTIVQTVLADTTRMPTHKEEKAARAAVAVTPAGEWSWLSVERGYQGKLGLALLAGLLGSAVITLGAAGIVTGLANADSRPDHATLSAVGANPRTRQLLAATSAGVTTALGSVLGVVAGLVPALAVLAYQAATAPAEYGRVIAPPMPIEIPWPAVALVVIAVPLAASVLAGAFTRARLEMRSPAPS